MGGKASLRIMMGAQGVDFRRIGEAAGLTETAACPISLP